MFHSAELEELARESYTPADLAAVTRLLHGAGTLDMRRLPSGLFPASGGEASGAETGYRYVWVRDNVHVAHAHLVSGRGPIAAGVVLALRDFFLAHRHRLDGIIAGTADPADDMARPHIRFDGPDLSELPVTWAHAQNDSLGSFVWLTCLVVEEDLAELDPPTAELLALFVRYFEAIRYWCDADSGHWEETKKVEASSIGCVVAGLTSLRRLVASRVDAGREVPGGLAEPGGLDRIDRLVAEGRAALSGLLPGESVDRDVDGALLFLIHPLDVVDADVADGILRRVTTKLQGEHGIRRYLGDSYWSPSYKLNLPAEVRTADFSDDLSGRDSLLPRLGLEAQWCIFDPTISTIHGRRYLRSGNDADLELQTRYLNRSLSQITADLACPELYYIEDFTSAPTTYVPNDNTPLLWTQANLVCALSAMDASLRHASSRHRDNLGK